MRKQELVQPHALCVALRVHLEDRHDAPSDAFRSYDEFGVSPSGIDDLPAASDTPRPPERES